MATIEATRKAQVVFDFNGSGASIIWGMGAFTEKDPTYTIFAGVPINTDKLEGVYKEKDDRTRVENDTVEVMPHGEEFSAWLVDKYGGDTVVGNVPVNDLPEILLKAKSLGEEAKRGSKG